MLIQRWHWSSSLLACKKVGSRLRGTELRLEIFRQENDEAADDGYFTADAEARHDVHRVCHQMPNSGRKIYRKTIPSIKDEKQVHFHSMLVQLESIIFSCYSVLIRKIILFLLLVLMQIKAISRLLLFSFSKITLVTSVVRIVFFLFQIKSNRIESNSWAIIWNFESNWIVIVGLKSNQK